MKYYKKENVFEEGLNRIRYLFDEFETVVVGFSGGKDSTVVLNLALQVAKEKNRLPLKVLFIDQEAEWQTVIDYVREVMYNPDIEPLWYQMPIKIFNATSTKEPWLYCWKEGEKWIREREDISIKENTYGTDRFHDIFGAILKKDFKGQRVCYLAGVRTEESPTRYTSLTSGQIYKHITYGKGLDKKVGQYTFYPLYDWSYTDIWKAIHDNKWNYCKIYDYMYMNGIQVMDMRVSNVHHETAVHALFFLQEVEPETWNKLSKRISGIATAGQLGKSDFFLRGKLPFMFKSWIEYRDYLVENLIQSPTIQETYRKKFADLDKKYDGMHYIEDLIRAQINTILANDYYFTKLNNFERNPAVNGWRNHKIGRYHPHHKFNKYIIGQ